MNRNQAPKLKSPPRTLFSYCGIFRNCTHSALSPRTPPSSSSPDILHSPPPPPPPPPQPANGSSSSSSSSSASASHSFTQWRFPLHHTHTHTHPPLDLADACRASELHFAAGDAVSALRILERWLSAPSPPAPASPALISGVAAALRDSGTARAASKVLLAIVLAEENRLSAVEAGAAAAAVEALASSGAEASTVKERTLAALELLCTAEEGAAEVRRHALVPAVIAGAAMGMAGRGRECAIGILAAMYGGERASEAPAEVGRAVAAALQGECGARGKRKGAKLLRAMMQTSRFDPAAAEADYC